ncbi:hypothetical protein PV326_001723 [Microctonus aethiopoides]|nr:hypothetical protein PV326_001723 [Microctonus aethiopoides]
MRNLVRDSTLEHVTWNGSHVSLALKGSRLDAFEETMNNNKKFGKVNRMDLADSVQRALHCAKERLKKSRISIALRNREEETLRSQSKTRGVFNNLLIPNPSEYLVSLSKNEVGTTLEGCERVSEGAVGDCHAKLTQLLSELC